MLSTQTITALIQTAHLLADAARVETLRYFRTPDIDTQNKRPSDFDPVTVADKAAEISMRNILQKHRPDDAILGEEFGHSSGKSGLTWVLDPIDGTRGYISGTASWGVLIAICDADGPIFGIIDQPYIGERFIGGLSHSVMHGRHGKRHLKARPPRPIEDAILFSTFPEIGTENERAAFTRVAHNVRLTRYGMDCYAYALLALGQIDLVIEAGLQAYDIQAPIAIVEAAGGVVTNWQGQPAHHGGQIIAAANPEIHAAALALLNKGHL